MASPQTVLLMFVNRYDLTAVDFDRAFEVSGRDIGERLGQRIIDERLRLGGSFASLEQLSKTPQLGPARMKTMMEVASSQPETLIKFIGSRTNPASTELEEFSPTRLPTIGGTRVSIRGNFVVGIPMEVTLVKGSKRTLLLGRDMSSIIHSSDGKTLEAIAPAMVEARGYDVEIVAFGESVARLENATSVVASTYSSGVFEQRSQYPSWAATGPRSIERT